MGLLGKLIKVALALTLAALAVHWVLPQAFARPPPARSQATQGTDISTVRPSTIEHSALFE